VREPVERPEPGESTASALTWTADEDLQPGAPVRATDGALGTLRERRVGQGPEHAYLGVDTDEGLLYVPERLVREASPLAIYLSLPVADVRAHSSRGRLPEPSADPTDLPQDR
jgi:hypothetical protein